MIKWSVYLCSRSDFSVTARFGFLCLIVVRIGLLFIPILLLCFCKKPLISLESASSCSSTVLSVAHSFFNSLNRCCGVLCACVYLAVVDRVVRLVSFVPTSLLVLISSNSPVSLLPSLSSCLLLVGLSFFVCFFYSIVLSLFHCYSVVASSIAP